MASITTLPEYESRSFAKWLVRATLKYFEDPEVARRFEAWKREQNEKLQNENA